VGHDYAGRIRRASERLDDAGLSGLVVAPGPDLVYLTGYDAPPLERLTALLLRAGRDPILVVPRLERPRAEDAGAGDVADLLDWPDGGDPYESVRSVLDSAGGAVGAVGAVGVSDRLWAVHLLGIQQALPEVAFGSAAPVLSPLRAVKDPFEVELLQFAASAADSAFGRIVEERFEGRTERDLAADLAALLVDEGHEVPLFTIVASGPNGASPHHEPTERVISGGEAVVMDFGGRRQGYSSDITRTVFVGEPAADARVVYDAVRAGQRAAFELAAPGVPAEDLDAAARQPIADAGFGERFIHRTGHGIGLEEHEDPYLVAGNAVPLREGNAFSIEPGIYLSGRFGVRIEDIVVVTDRGARSLNDATRDPIVVA
jgi:D-alanyl-D-alanine dipeptidase